MKQKIFDFLMALVVSLSLVAGFAYGINLEMRERERARQVKRLTTEVWALRATVSANANADPRFRKHLLPEEGENRW